MQATHFREEWRENEVKGSSGEDNNDDYDNDK